MRVTIWGVTWDDFGCGLWRETSTSSVELLSRTLRCVVINASCNQCELKNYPGLNDFSDQAGPPSLMGSTNSSAAVAMKILVKVNVVSKMRIVLEPVILTKYGAPAFLISRKESRQPAA